MSFFRKKRFGSENRKAFEPEEKYKSYNDKKKHEAELWADLLKETLLPYTPENAKIIGVDCVEKEDKNYKEKNACFYIIQMLRRLLPDQNMTVCTHNRRVRLSTLAGKTPDTSRTHNALICLNKSCQNSTVGVIKAHLKTFLAWLSGGHGASYDDSLYYAIKKMRPGDLLYSLRKQCTTAKIYNSYISFLGSEYGVDDCKPRMLADELSKR